MITHDGGAVALFTEDETKPSPHIDGTQNRHWLHWRWTFTRQPHSVRMLELVDSGCAVGSTLGSEQGASHLEGTTAVMVLYSMGELHQLISRSFSSRLLRSPCPFRRGAGEGWDTPL